MSRRFERAQGFVEYILLIALISGTVALSLRALGITVRDIYCLVAGTFGFDQTCVHYFYDPFDTLDAWKVVSGKWSVRNGKLYGGPGEGRIFTDISADNYVITLHSATLEQGNGYGVFFRVTNTPRFNGYSFQYDPGYKAFIYRKWVNGYELNPPFAVARAPNYEWHGYPRDIQIVVKGNTFTTYVDGHPVLTATDNSYPEGGIGLRVWDATEANFDAISVDAIR